MGKNILIILLLGVIVVPGEILANDSINVLVTVEGFRSEDGVCRLLLFKTKKGFPDSPEYAILMLSEKIENNKAEFSFKVKSGTYAISVLHDQNTNEKMDKTWYGKPTEGFGASNNPKIKFSAPGFKESAVMLDSKNNHLKIKLNYL